MPEQVPLSRDDPKAPFVAEFTNRLVKRALGDPDAPETDQDIVDSAHEAGLTDDDIMAANRLARSRVGGAADVPLTGADAAAIVRDAARFQVNSAERNAVPPGPTSSK